MSLFSAVRGLWWVGSEVVEAVKQLATFQPGQDDYRAHMADVLADKEAAEEVAEPWGDAKWDITCEVGEGIAEPQGDCGLGGGDAELPTLVRLWVDGYQSDPITAFVDGWGSGRFTITPEHPFAEFVTAFPIPQAPLTVYGTDELEWVVDRVDTDHTAYGPEYTVTCKPRVNVLRQSLISDEYLCWLWLDAEKRFAESSSAAPGVAPVDAADNGPGVTHSPTPGPPSLNWCAAEMRQVADLLLTTGLPMALGYANDLRAAAAEMDFEIHGQDPASVHDRTMRQRHNEDREQ